MKRKKKENWLPVKFSVTRSVNYAECDRIDFELSTAIEINLEENWGKKLEEIARAFSRAIHNMFVDQNELIDHAEEKLTNEEPKHTIDVS